ncbi:MAG: DUF1622 domain-containing protein [Candidatus Cloacimonetes bacterium]|nr:DUF1622 domain-containing protein [Candidatus Cloacimonadota bacterium]MBS3767313.1 DUF1622 domain-containing protein [Candidatus Cloacimonadota bacterium]
MNINGILEIISKIIGIVGVVVICWGSLLIVFRLIRLELKRFKQRSIFREREAIRHQLGSYILLGLEFMIAADIVVTITHPTLQGVAVLGSIVIIRAIISHFLEHEVAEFRPPEEK